MSTMEISIDKVLGPVPRGESVSTVSAVVLVQIHDNCVPTCQWVNLRKPKKDRIIWVSGGPKFDIHFDNGTPFQDENGRPVCDFVVPPGGSADSGPPELGKKGESYHYTITCAQSRTSYDPGVSVKE